MSESRQLCCETIAPALCRRDTTCKERLKVKADRKLKKARLRFPSVK